MGLSSLTFIDEGKLPNDITAFTNPPIVAPGSGNLDNEIVLNILGYQSSNPNVLIFEVIDSSGVSSMLTLNNDENAIHVVNGVSPSRDPVTDYYSVDVGMNTVSGGDWSLDFNVSLNDGETAPYIFVKGKTTDDLPGYTKP